ncbi:sigma-70 family RNA polymerase sigma factor [Streptomyces sp. NPDC127092]|uniref:sigma-70 family RNA polymerase sigma factor n=1 Tax=Streptomyces sp. NPDC127092 TaxID=3347135 RepID=UPI0036655A32
MAPEIRDEAAHLRWQRMWSHREQLLKVARRRSMSAEDAEDAVQEAMLRAAQHAHLDDERLGAWLTTVTMRLCVDRYRQVHREAEVGSAPRLTAPGPVPVEEVVCDRAEARWVAFRSRELPARQAEALRLKAEDRDVDQIAREMGLSYQAVESLLARARRTLRNSLAGTLAVGLWLIGRGRDQAGQAGVPAHALAATSVATLAVVGLVVVPFAYEAGTPRPARPAVSDPAEENARYVLRVPTPSARPVTPADPAHPAGEASPTALPPSMSPSPSLVPVPVPVPVPAPEVTLPEPDVEGVLPEASAPLPSLPAAPSVGLPPVPVPGTGAVRVALPDVPVTPDAPAGLP